MERDAKALVKLYGAKGDEIIIASQNRDSLRVFVRTLQKQYQLMDLQPMDHWAEVTRDDGKKLRLEFYYGSGYLSQSSRRLRVPIGTKELVIYDYSGNSRK